jgi:hypothetical protein
LKSFKFTASLVDLYKATHKPKAVTTLWKDGCKIYAQLNQWISGKMREGLGRGAEIIVADLPRSDWH